ncbi:uncharacterized protein LOC125965092 isoform X2 [Orcinus orca]|nr:uncharacterized protein LOC125965092 isoform X2 [Orcinus orca]
MKLFTGLILCSLVLGVHSRWFSFLGEAYDGAKDMWRAYSDMREANYKDADKYFHARGNYDAARRGPGGVWAAEVISSCQSPRFLGKRRDGEGGLLLVSPGVIPYLPSSIPAMPGRIVRESQTFLSMETVATDGRTRRLTSLPIDGAGAAKTPITSDLLACPTSTELPLTLLRRRRGCEPPRAGTLSL